MNEGIGPAGAVLRVDKPAGPTSHDMVARVRRALGVRRVGHTGTLDPFASGLLLICVGPATRLSEYLTGLPKSYTATLRLGEETNTLDTEGTVVATDDAWRELTSDAIEGALERFRGTMEQTPPAFSAKKVNGERAYVRARRGETALLEAVRVTVFELELARVDLPEIDLRCTCSSGTYVRVLGRDVAHALGTVGSLTALRRTGVGAFGVGGAVDGGALGAGEAIPGSAWVDPVRALEHFPRAEVDSEQAGHLRQGRFLEWERPEEGPVVVTLDGALVCVARVDRGSLRPLKVFPA